MENHNSFQTKIKFSLLILLLIFTSVLTGYMLSYTQKTLNLLIGAVFWSMIITYLYIYTKGIVASFKKEIKKTSDYLKQVANGEDVEILDKNGYSGEMLNLINSVNEIRTSHYILFEESNNLANAINEGNLNVRGNITGLNGKHAKIINEINNMLDSIEHVQNIFAQVSKGDMSSLDEIKKMWNGSKKDILIPEMVMMMESINGLADEVNMLLISVQNGDLSKRADISHFEGDYKHILDGFNKTLDIIVEPLSESLKVLYKMAVNDFTLEVEGKHNGMLKELTDQINIVKGRLQNIQNIAILVSQGDISRLDEFTNTEKRSENDNLIPALKNMVRILQDLTCEANLISDAAVNGDLTVRGNTDRFNGGYKDIIYSINKTMDAIERPLSETMNVLNEMLDGNLASQIQGSYNGDYDKLKVALNSTVKSFNDVLKEIQGSSQHVASSSKQVSDSSQALSNGAAEQASAIEQLSASLEQISYQTRENAHGADKANTMVLGAKEDAIAGNEHMKEMLSAMSEINDASGNISKIIKVIDEIAFQTNILALNAAVEAARAGQFGKGFAVVAEEVRNLAGRSADAAKETTNLIEGSIKKVEQGTKIADNTATALNKIVDAVSNVAGLVSKIANASNEQDLGIKQINQGIIQVSNVVQTNSATSQESAASSYELSMQAQVLKTLADKFKLGTDNSNTAVLSGTFEHVSNDNTSKLEVSEGDKVFRKY